MRRNEPETTDRVSGSTTSIGVEPTDGQVVSLVLLARLHSRRADVSKSYRLAMYGYRLNRKARN